MKKWNDDPEVRNVLMAKHGVSMDPEMHAMSAAMDLQRAMSEQDIAKAVGRGDEYDRLHSAWKIQTNGVPDAPLKKNWNEFLMKKALHDAAVGGYDKLAWTTGKTQADRYRKVLQDNISEINYKKLPDNRYAIAFKKPGDTSFTPYGNTLGADALGDHLGEHIANQIKNDTGESIPYIVHDPRGTQALREMGVNDGFHFKGSDGETFHGKGATPEEAKQDLIRQIPRLEDQKIIRGENISIGDGKGMVGFYDKMQGDFLNNFLKKYGEKVHQDHALGYEKAEPVNAVNITPEMRKDLTEKGFPFFKEGGLVALKKKKK
jgi:hypothetical protein